MKFNAFLHPDELLKKSAFTESCSPNLIFKSKSDILNQCFLVEPNWLRYMAGESQEDFSWIKKISSLQSGYFKDQKAGIR